MNDTSLNDHARNPAKPSTMSAAPAPDPARDGAGLASTCETSFHSHATLQKWLAEFLISRGDGDLIKVVLQDSSDGEDSSLVVVPLRNATTTVYLRPPTSDDSRWRVIFEAQPEETSLTHEQTRALTAELDTAAELCAYLEQRSSSHTEPLPLP